MLQLCASAPDARSVGGRGPTSPVFCPHFWSRQTHCISINLACRENAIASRVRTPTEITRHATALIVDHNMEKLLSLASVFRASGYTVETANDPGNTREALTKCMPPVAPFNEEVDGDDAPDLLERHDLSEVVATVLSCRHSPTSRKTTKTRPPKRSGSTSRRFTTN